jgi:hypothetical protein
MQCAGTCGFGKKPVKKSRSSSKKHKRTVHRRKFGTKSPMKKAKKAKKTKRTRSHRTVKRRFGSQSNMISLAQSYTGQAPNQALMHYNNIPEALRTNFYMNLDGQSFALPSMPMPKKQ